MELVDGAFDASWRTAGEYDPGDTFTRATDARGHKESRRVQMPPDLWERVCAFTASGTVPSYQSPSDFIRDALVHRLQYWHMNTLGDWRPGWSVVFSGIKAAERAEQVRQLRELPGAHSESLQLAMDEGLYEIVQSGIEHLLEIAPTLPDPIRGELLKMAEKYEQELVTMKERQSAVGIRAV